MTTEARSASDNSKIQIRKILIPIDGSEYSLDAAKYAIRIAKDEKAQLFCIHVITPQIPYGYAAATTDGQYYEDIKDKVESWFDKTEIFIDVKSVIESVVDYASRRNIDLIVIGTRGRTGLKRFLMGSVANSAVQHAHCPVLLVR